MGSAWQVSSGRFMAELPDTFRSRMRALLGTAAGAFFTSFERPPSVGLRVNTLKLDPASLARLTGWQLAPLPWTAAGFTMTHDDAAAIRLGRHPWDETGSLLSPGSQCHGGRRGARTATGRVDSRPGGGAWRQSHAPRVAAAGPGPTRRQRSAPEQNPESGTKPRGVAVWPARSSSRRRSPGWRNDSDPASTACCSTPPARAKACFGNRPKRSPIGRRPPCTPAPADRPICSPMPSRLVRPEGRLGYSTCTFAPEENEQAITGFLGSHPDFELEPVSLPGSTPGRPAWAGQSPTSALHLERSVRLWPHLAEGEGHFMAIMHRSSEHAPVPPRSERSAAKRAADESEGTVAGLCSRGHYGETPPKDSWLPCRRIGS